MKKYIGISLVVLIVGMLACCVWITYDSRDYFKDYFEVKRQKLDLRSESSVDSLKTIIFTNQKQIDSLSVEVVKYKELGENDIINYKQQIKNLQNVINHQNQMIDNLKKK